MVIPRSAIERIKALANDMGLYDGTPEEALKTLEALSEE